MTTTEHHMAGHEPDRRHRTKGNPIRNGSAAREQSRIEPVEGARDPNTKPGQEVIGDQEEC
jgi:hypothetical protein